jgi:Dyp-type peroxidase family
MMNEPQPAAPSPQIDLTKMVEQKVETSPGNFQTVNPIGAFDDVQGNILKGHGRPYVQCLFLTFLPNQKEDICRWISSLAKNGTITSASRQLQETEAYHRTGKPGGLFGAFFLSHRGYDYLGETLPDDARFQDGMAVAGPSLADPEKSTWDKGFQADIHAMLLLADLTESGLQQKVTRVLAPAAALLGPIHVEHGHVINNENGDGIEHFGYVDGVSQPIFIEADVQKLAANGQENPALWNPAAPLDLVLVKDPNGEAPGAYGSYFVFRKLEQDVEGFKKAEKALARKLKLDGEDEERAGALLIGRFEDGTPVTLQAAEGIKSPVINGFNYDNDLAGAKCPYFAHIRKTNPRGDSVRQFGVPLEQERGHRIARRGIPYGKRRYFLTDQPSKNVGLLFMCYQQDIANQFEFMQARWANAPDFVKDGTGLDPVIGQGARTAQDYPKVWAGSDTGAFTFGRFVTLKGGEYFFAPSLSFLKSLSAS